MIEGVRIGDITFNDNPNYWITGVQGLEVPRTRLASYNLAGEHFGYHVNAFYSKRRFSLDGTVVGDTVADFMARRRALQSALDILDGERPIVFTLAGGQEVQLDAVLVSLDFPLRAGFVNAGDFHAEFEASFPFLRGLTQYTQAFVLASGGGGAVPATVPMTLAADSGGKIFVTNGGNGVAYPTARISGPVTNPSLRNATTGEEIRLDITLAVGEYLDLDFRRKTVTDQSGRNRYDAKEGDWWTLAPGTNEVRFIADSGDPAAQTTFTSLDAWLGI